MIRIPGDLRGFVMIVHLDFSGFLLIKHHIQNGTVIAIPRHIDTDIDPELRSFDLQLCCLLTPLHGNQGIRRNRDAQS